MKKMYYLKKHSPRLLGLLIMAFFLLHLCYTNTDDFLQVIPLKCPLHFLFNIKCPFCGLGHAILEANLQHFSMSLEHHVLGIGIYGYLVILALGLILLPKQTTYFHKSVIDVITSKIKIKDR